MFTVSVLLNEIGVANRKYGRHYLSRKIKLTGNSEFHYLINILTIPFTCRFKLFLSTSEAKYIEYLTETGGNCGIRVRIEGLFFDIMLNYQLF